MTVLALALAGEDLQRGVDPGQLPGRVSLPEVGAGQFEELPVLALQRAVHEFHVAADRRRQPPVLQRAADRPGNRYDTLVSADRRVTITQGQTAAAELQQGRDVVGLQLDRPGIGVAGFLQATESLQHRAAPEMQFGVIRMIAGRHIQQLQAGVQASLCQRDLRQLEQSLQVIRPAGKYRPETSVGLVQPPPGAQSLGVAHSLGNARGIVHKHLKYIS